MINRVFDDLCSMKPEKDAQKASFFITPPFFLTPCSDILWFLCMYPHKKWIFL